MRIFLGAMSAGVGMALLASPMMTAPAAALVHPGPDTVVRYDMNEPAGTTVMTDSINGINGVVDPRGVQSGFSFGGATGYHWARRAPNLAPPSPERIVQVPDNPLLEPGSSSTFTLTIRYRTRENFGNITQQGQARSVGGQWKIQHPKGIPSCLFKGSQGRVATGAKTPLNDNAWHELECVKTQTSVTMFVDGVFRSRKVGVTGPIDNRVQMTVGGKLNCDQVNTTCDYFSGDIDYIQIDRS